jgi:hypothetical protein
MVKCARGGAGVQRVGRAAPVAAAHGAGVQLAYNLPLAPPPGRAAPRLGGRERARAFCDRGVRERGDMFYRIRELQFDARPQKPDPIFAKQLQEVLGGQWGEMSVMMGYLFQG